MGRLDDELQRFSREESTVLSGAMLDTRDCPATMLLHSQRCGGNSTLALCACSEMLHYVVSLCNVFSLRSTVLKATLRNGQVQARRSRLGHSHKSESAGALKDVLQQAKIWLYSWGGWKASPVESLPAGQKNNSSSTGAFKTRGCNFRSYGAARKVGLETGERRDSKNKYI